MKGLTTFTDYFVICSGESTTQVKAIAGHIEETLLKKPKRLKPLSMEGMGYGHWVLLDYADVIIHIFEDSTREYYRLEKLWLDAPRISLDEDAAPVVRQD